MGEGDRKAEEWRLLEVVYPTLADHEPLRRALIEVRRRQGEAARNTIFCFTVQAPCVQLGEFQDIDEEVDAAECARAGVSLCRRVGGGGCLFYDENTRFAVALLDRGICENLEEAARTWQGEAVTGTFRDLGAREASYRHIGDVQIGPAKVSGLGTALIHNTLYLGSFMNIGTPRVDLARRVLRIPPEKFADKAVSSLDDYVSSVEKATGRLPSWEEFREAVRRNVERVFKVRLVRGEISPEEKAVFEELRPVYTSEEWLYQRSSERRFSGLPPGARRGKSRRKARKLVIGHAAADSQGKILRAMLCGDFFIQPAGAVEEIEKALEGLAAGDGEKIRAAVGETLSRLNAQTPMLSPEDFALPLIAAARQAVEGVPSPGSRVPRP